MFDYKLLEALSSVVEEEGFENAAVKLYITQSAVSQRIKTLEQQLGQILISRETPPVPTKKGWEMIKLYRQVRLLESDLIEESDKQIYSIGVNADSLATWFLPVLQPLLTDEKFQIELKVDDQDKTSEMLKKGEVAGCVSSSSKAIQGCRVHYLGEMNYYPVSTLDFSRKWFPQGMTESAVAKAPSVIFNRKDRLHDHYLSMIIDFKTLDYPRSYIPSSEKFVDLIAMGAAYGIVPELQIRQEVCKEKLVILRQEELAVPLYWHHWNMETESLKAMTDLFLSKSSKYLKKNP